MLRPDGVKEKRYCGFHDRNSHSINECRVFRMRIQKAIQEGHLKFDNKIKLYGNPFPQNMIGFSVSMVNVVEEKRKMKVSTSAKAKQDGSVDPARQVTFEHIHKREPRFLKSQIEVGESSKPGVTRVFSSTSGSVSKKRSATRSINTKRRIGDMKKRCAGRNKKNI
jgi:hypothetical protein